MTSNWNAHRSGIVFMGPKGEENARIGAGAGIGRHMRVFEGVLRVTRTSEINDCAIGHVSCIIRDG